MDIAKIPIFLKFAYWTIELYLEYRRKSKKLRPVLLARLYGKKHNFEYNYNFFSHTLLLLIVNSRILENFLKIAGLFCPKVANSSFWIYFNIGNTFFWNSLIKIKKLRNYYFESSLPNTLEALLLPLSLNILITASMLGNSQLNGNQLPSYYRTLITLFLFLLILLQTIIKNPQMHNKRFSNAP